MAQTALIIGATGLVGSHLLQQLLVSKEYSAVRIFVRRPTGIEHEKLAEFVVDFEQPELWHKELQGTVLFSTLGTTLARAGSKEAQYQVDYTFQYEAAAAAAKNGVAQYVLVSSAGADVKSAFFYSRMKGELDRDVQALPFTCVRIVKPSVLDGDRAEKRLGESIGLALGKFLAPLIPPLRKYRPIHARKVALAMQKAIFDQPENKSIQYEFQEVFTLSDRE